MEGGIDKISVAAERFNVNWGVDAYDYRYDNQDCDLQDLVIMVTQERAMSIEGEVDPVSQIISARNKRIEKYGFVLSKLTELQAKFASSGSQGETKSIQVVFPTDGSITRTDFNSIMAELGYPGLDDSNTLTMNKSQCEGACSQAKTSLDAMNNAAQKDMTRLQAVVDRRDESFSAATSLMQAISDTRTAVIKGM